MFAALGIVSGLQRFAVTAGLIIALAGGIWVWAEARELAAVHRAVIQRDAMWAQKFAEASLAAEKDRDAQQTRIDQAAAVARAVAAGDVLAATSRVATLEASIVAMKDDPVVFPRALARSLRR